MKEQSTGEKRSKITFIALYVGSMLLLAAIFSLFIPSRTVMRSAEPAATAAPNIMVKADAFLHHRYERLQTLDASFAAALADSSISKEPIMTEIAVAESDFRSSLDSLQKINDAKGGGAGFSEADSMVASFRTMLSSRRTLTTFRNLLSTEKKSIGSDEVEQVKVANELQEKDQEIATLQKQLKLAETDLARASKPSMPVATSSPVENPEIVDQLNQRLGAARKDNDNLTSQLNASKKMASDKEGQLADVREKLASLEKNSGELAAELRFAQVDCNLSRANIKEIISNSRQRQELLTQSLSILNDLARSDNAAVQRKAKEKLVQLKNIASVIHD